MSGARAHTPHGSRAGGRRADVVLAQLPAAEPLGLHRLLVKGTETVFEAVACVAVAFGSVAFKARYSAPRASPVRPKREWTTAVARDERALKVIFRSVMSEWRNVWRGELLLVVLMPPEAGDTDDHAQGTILQFGRHYNWHVTTTGAGAPVAASDVR